MKRINENLKIVGIVNSIFSVIAIVFRLFQFNLDLGLLTNLDTFVCIIALLFGIFYSLSGYKKEDAKYFKAFMVLCFISSIFSLLTPIYLNIKENGAFVLNQRLIENISNIVIVICSFILAFSKDLGMDKSNNAAYVILLLSIIKLVACKLGNRPLAGIAACVSNLILAIIIVVFVSAKYLDKASRGSK